MNSVWQSAFEWMNSEPWTVLMTLIQWTKLKEILKGALEWDKNYDLKMRMCSTIGTLHVHMLIYIYFSAALSLPIVCLFVIQLTPLGTFQSPITSST